MALQDGFPSASGLADANDVRLALAGLIVRDSSGNPRTGIFPRHTNALVTSTATMNSSVAAFEAAVSRAGQGVILLPNNGATNVPHDPAPVANSRYDIVYVKQNDSVSPNADANDLPVFGILKGSASVSPTLPTYATAKVALDAAPGIGAGAEPLATVLIPSTATTMQSAGVVYTQLYQYTATTGGVVPFRTKTALDLWTTAQKDQTAVVLADSTRWAFNGTAWASVGSLVRHAEYTTSVSLANATGGTVGTLTAVPSLTQNADFISVPSAGTVRLKAGIYAIRSDQNIGANSTGLSIVGISIAGDPYRSYMPSGSSSFHFSTPNWVIAADNTDVELYLYQTTGGTRSVTGRVGITKVG